MRLDRLISVAVVRPGLSVAHAINFGAKGHHRPLLPILMYHSVSGLSGEETHPSYYGVRTTPEQFERHMYLIAASGRRGVTISQALDSLNEGGGSGPQSPGLVALTFDDGFRDFFTHAAPILEKYGFSATVYLPTAFIGNERRTFKSTECLVWNEVLTLRANGFEFGSHTDSHAALDRLSQSDIEAELARSKAIIEQRLGAAVVHFAYPFAYPQANTAFSRRFRDLLQALGYSTCVTTKIGRVAPHDDRLQLKRLPVNSADDDALFMAKLAGAYDWLGGPQAVYKRALQLAH